MIHTLKNIIKSGKQKDSIYKNNILGLNRYGINISNNSNVVAADIAHGRLRLNRAVRPEKNNENEKQYDRRRDALPASLRVSWNN